ncbi:MAG: DUF4123 domain-containing protein, partial [Rudaea sp.]
TDPLDRLTMAAMHAPPLEISESTVDDLRAILKNAPGSLYAVLDACDEPRVPEKTSHLRDRAVSLYRGSAERDFWAIAPYLVQIDEPVFDWIVGNLWGNPWGVFLVAPVDLATLRKHLRRFLTVHDAEGRAMYFRFYDPRVLITFLSACDTTEVSQFFGPAASFAITAEYPSVKVIGRRLRTPSPSRNPEAVWPGR